jgi:hypothetical protein
MVFIEDAYVTSPSYNSNQKTYVKFLLMCVFLIL